MMTPVYCGEIGRSPVQLVADWLRGGGSPEFSHEASQKAIFTQSGRAAVWLTARLWKIGNNDEILVPAYNCGSEISPIIATGARVKMYRVDSSAQIDLGDVVPRMTSRTRLVYVTHYFGRPNLIGELAAICRERNVKVIEDCALSLFSRTTGCAGDAVIFSLRKSLPASDGGVLLLRDLDCAGTGFTERPALGSIARGALSLVKKWSQSSIWPLAARHREGAEMRPGDSLPDLPASYYWPAGAVACGASRFALGLLARTDPKEVIRRRRENYLRLRARVSGVSGLRFLWKEDLLADGLCPLGLPVLVDDRRRWWRALNSAGVEVSCWWEGYHRGLDWSEFPEARTLKDHLLLLPVHQGLSGRHMDYIADVVHSFSVGCGLPSAAVGERPKQPPISKSC
jgi:perosamine synthetase